MRNPVLDCAARAPSKGLQGRAQSSGAAALGKFCKGPRNGESGALIQRRRPAPREMHVLSGTA
jgi:hypothetical protein